MLFILNLHPQRSQAKAGGGRRGCLAQALAHRVFAASRLVKRFKKTVFLDKGSYCVYVTCESREFDYSGFVGGVSKSFRVQKAPDEPLSFLG
jgi:hypothetical protein